MAKGWSSQDSAAVLRVSDACGAAEMANFGSSVGGRTPSCHPEIRKVVISGHADHLDQGIPNTVDNRCDWSFVKSLSIRIVLGVRGRVAGHRL
jgi:hypothetical protein